jgi:hypothetical protein
MTGTWWSKRSLWLGYLAGIVTLFAASVHSVAAPTARGEQTPRAETKAALAR